MDELELSILQVSAEDPPFFAEEQRVAIQINGRSLIDLAQEAISTPAQSSAPPAFLWMPLLVMAPPATHLLGRPRDAEDESFQGKPFLLSCRCGFAGDGGLFAAILLSDSSVQWVDFARVPNTEVLAGLGPYTFPRMQYEAAMRSITRSPERG